MRTDVHAHLCSEGYLRLLESYGRQDAAAHRGLGAGDSAVELAARFAMNDAAGIDHQILSACTPPDSRTPTGLPLVTFRYPLWHPRTTFPSL
ncbi:hypothetical protein QT196_36590 [Streptomyces sp. P9-2B-2]|uniref:hypothetical protein n=1 Tax=Streptomyces sp. P9-2B-2 TaxID=3057114 RepID=UPI0025B34604|nr:hypothetical protein [Streptomyces sp. P9-2B-2]WJY42329.1 hypothetical protein QT196_36590 [Streptomyces sp. P9-2B-2]